MIEQAPFYNDLDLSLAEAKALIADGACDRKRSAHHPVVATIGCDGSPSQRVMILRAVDWERRRLRFHTDYRTTKVEELGQRNLASVLIYEPDAKIQLRLAGTATVHTKGAVVDSAWDEATLFARRCYLAEQSPGKISPEPLSGLPANVEGRQPTEQEVAAARVNFAALIVEFGEIEWLYLANSGHRRARWQWDSAAADWRRNWLVP